MSTWTTGTFAARSSFASAQLSSTIKATRAQHRAAKSWRHSAIPSSVSAPKTAMGIGSGAVAEARRLGSRAPRTWSKSKIRCHRLPLGLRAGVFVPCVAGTGERLADGGEFSDPLTSPGEGGEELGRGREAARGGEPASASASRSSSSSRKENGVVVAHEPRNRLSTNWESEEDLWLPLWGLPPLDADAERRRPLAAGMGRGAECVTGDEGWRCGMGRATFAVMVGVSDGEGREGWEMG